MAAHRIAKLERSLVISIRCGAPSEASEQKAFHAVNNLAKDLGFPGFTYDPDTHWGIRLRCLQIDQLRMQCRLMGASDELVAALDWRDRLGTMIEVESPNFA